MSIVIDSSPRRRPRSAQEEADVLAEFLLYFARGQVAVERQVACRVLAEAMRSFPGPASTQWSKWLVEAGRSVGLQLRPIDCTTLEAWDLRRAGTRMTGWSKGELASGVTLGEVRGSVCEVTIYAEGVQKARLNVRDLAKSLALSSRKETTRWVLHDPFAGSMGGQDVYGHNQQGTLASHTGHAAATGHLPGQHGHAKPIQRLWRLLKPEVSDLWVIGSLALMMSLLVLATPITAQELMRTVMFGSLYQPIAVLTVTLFCFLSFVAILQGLQIFAVEIIQRRLFTRLAADLSYRLPRVHPAAIRNVYTPELVNRFFEVVTVQKVIGSLLVDGVSLILTTVIGMILLAAYNPFFLGYDIALLVMMVTIVFILGRGGVPTAIDESLCKYRTAAWLQDIGRCPLAFHTAGGGDFAAERADTLVAEYLAARKRHFRVLLRQLLAILALQALASTVLLGMGGYLVISEQLTLGQLVAAELIVSMIVSAYAKSMKHVEGWYDLMASLDKIGHLIDLPVEPQHGLMALPNTGGASVACHELHLHSTHDFYSHESRNTKTVSFSVRPGESFAVLGPPGAGKSSLLDMLYGLQHPSGGHVEIDGYGPLDLRVDLLRQHVALARSIEVLPTTIFENVHLNRPGCDGHQVRRALELVCLYDEVLMLEEGLQTPLSANGTPLSNSQLTRLMLARAIVTRPRLLLVDGLLDGLPDELAANVTLNLSTSPERWTMIVATGQNRIARVLPNTVLLETKQTMAAHLPEPKSHR